MSLPVNDKRVIELIKQYRNPLAGALLYDIYGIPIMASPPPAIPGYCRRWIDSAHYAAGAETMMQNGVQLVFPDGTNKGLSIPFSLISF